jgi:Na+-transporting NADH:ubiquinone oxidoreductase subunit NqrF
MSEMIKKLKQEIKELRETLDQKEQYLNALLRDSETDDWDVSLDDYSYPKEWIGNTGFIFSMLVNLDKAYRPPPR